MQESCIKAAYQVQRSYVSGHDALHAEQKQLFAACLLSAGMCIYHLMYAPTQYTIWLCAGQGPFQHGVQASGPAFSTPAFHNSLEQSH